MMDEYSADVFANRDEPLLSSFGNQDPAATSSRPSPKERLKAKLLVGSSNKEPKEDEGKNERNSLSIQDRLFTKLLQQVMPAEDVGEQDEDGDKRTKHVARPPFSLPVMTTNFRRFNARIGIAFVFQNRMIHLFSWRYPTKTWSFLAAYSFVCLNPYLLVVLPPAIVLLFIMVPAFLARHPPPPSASTSGTTPYYSYEGPALAPAKTIKPASETSKDFFRNMRDLQNSMADFANLHDTLVAAISPPTNFSDETLSSTVFLILTFVTASLFLVAHIIPWRLALFFGGNAAVISSHPAVQEFLRRAMDHGDEQADQSISKPNINKEVSLKPTPSLPTLLGPMAEISLDSSPEEREVEIFELQHRSISPFSASSEWETLLFSPLPYDPLSPSRIAGDRPRGCRFFEDVQAPLGWIWKGKKWELDLECREWVVERMITGVGFEIPGSSPTGNGDLTEDQVGGWVWDLPSAAAVDGDLDVMAYGDLNESPNPESTSKGKVTIKGGQSRDWEEIMQAQAAGEWRRRRWVRVVHRVSVPASDKGTKSAFNRD
ncbi:putative integral peroxisomal membrane peroxin [Talaromyces proteolyticus]|uniref:Integral peroxisomal membrane peroxin n=1 Tax=Talaromyces proteolyticus TaxID=1131652 RepID=A0AAD4PX14_9EURO|nr:putative integral peroxisomal membrane peroxin [Talaromyces proteolyticus]KAH8692611.1 putative integral peroxisomal membrane peroxin [Talaromyces proteolyticus]